MMPTEKEISINQQSLYDSAALRDDLNDTEATILLTWGEGQVARVAKDFPDEFEQKNRFLRQVIKGINRFVGQREFNELEGQKEYMSKITMYLPQLGWGHLSEEVLFAALPADKKDMFGTLRAILNLLSPPTESAPAGPAAAIANPPVSESPAAAIANNPTMNESLAAAIANNPAMNESPAAAIAANQPEITNPYNPTLENSNSESINQADTEIDNEE